MPETEIIQGDCREIMATLPENCVDSIVTDPPTDLMAYLCRLVTPKGGVVLDPFCGSGSTGKAAVREGFDFLGIELDPEYAEIARKRIEAEAAKSPLYSEASCRTTDG